MRPDWTFVEPSSDGLARDDETPRTAMAQCCRCWVDDKPQEVAVYRQGAATVKGVVW